MRPRLLLPSRSGSALVTTLLVIVVLTIIVTAFLQSMTIERQTARSYMNRYNAELMTRAGANTAVNLVQSLIQNHPDSVTSWDSDVSPTSGFLLPSTTLYYYDPSPVGNNPSTQPVLNFRPLVSGLVGGPIDPTAGMIPKPTLDPKNIAHTGGKQEWVNINAAKFGFGGTPQNTNATGALWIGKFPQSIHDPLPATNPDSKVEIPWVEVSAPDPATNQNKVIGRYAFWVEDESFRVNLNVPGASPRNKTEGGSPKDSTLQVFSKSVEALKDISDTQFAQAAVSLRTDGALKVFPSLPTLNHILPGKTDLYNDLGFLTTLNSEGSDLSRTGARRLNLNKVVTNTSVATDLEKEVRRIKQAIAYQAPSFGQRFYGVKESNSSTTVPTAGNLLTDDTSEAAIYLFRIAANIHDYIDTDNRPTVIQAGGTVYAKDPTEEGAIGGSSAPAVIQNPMIAIGKEAVPRLQETALRVKQSTMTIASTTYDIKTSYYLEFWNTSTKDIYVTDDGSHDHATSAFLESSKGANDAFLLIANQPDWKDVSTGGFIGNPKRPSEQDVKVEDLSLFKDGNNQPLVFKAGEVTVLTTDPNPETAVGTGPALFRTAADAAKVFRITGKEQHYTGTFGAKKVADNYGGYQTIELITRTQPEGFPSASGGLDAQTEIVLGNAKGYLESHPQALVIQPGIWVDGFHNSNSGTKVKDVANVAHFRGGVLKGNTGAAGNNAPKQFGDPTANNEQLDFTASNNITTQNATAFTNWRGGASQSAIDSAQKSSLGSFKTSTGTLTTDPSATGSFAWPSGTSANALQPLASGGSLYYIKDNQLTSIGELGFIFDPRRNATGTAARSNPGGGRTLRIGQPETKLTSSSTNDFPVWDGKSNSAARAWTAWRLLDIFSTTDDLAITGAINMNSVLRDGGAALRTTLQGLTFLGDGQVTDIGSTGHPNSALSDADIDKFIKALKDRFSQPGALPFFERGELSELDIFDNGTFSSKPQNKMSDRGAEEIFRRVVELTTTRGNIFSAYVIGQAVREDSKNPSGLAVLATQITKITFRLVPVFNTTPPPAGNLESFDPTSESSVTARFAKPDHYDVQILRVSN